MPGVEISVTTVPSAVRIHLRTRFRYWQWRRRVRKMGVEVLVDELARRTDEAMIYGEERTR